MAAELPKGEYLMKKIISIIIVLMILSTNLGFAVKNQEISPIDISKSSMGIIGVQYASANDSRLKVMIEKDNVRYTYNLNNDEMEEYFPLQLQDGIYKISILENTQGNRFRYLLTKSVDVDLYNTNKTFLQSMQLVNWDESMKAIIKAEELTKDLETDGEKVKAIYEYIINNIKYDYTKIGNLAFDYLPQIDETFTTNKGICYDFASIFAGMLRSIGIPTKLVKGYTENVEGYHAWNEVYLDGKWIVVDTSYDSQMVENGKKHSMIKDAKEYDKAKEF